MDKDSDQPILAVDVDGVISLFGFDGQPPPDLGRYHLVDGIPHLISERAGPRLRRLAGLFEMVWATGWEDRANDHLPHLLGLPANLPVLHFERAVFGEAHWKIGPISAHAGRRPLAWIDDSLDGECHEWARRRSAPTLLVPTESHIGIEEAHVDVLLEWAERFTVGA